jgi:hypothetical protein
VTLTAMGTSVAWGVHPERMLAPILGLPEGAKVVRRRQRCKSVMEAFVKGADGSLARHYVGVKPNDDSLYLLWPVGLNKKEGAK